MQPSSSSAARWARRKVSYSKERVSDIGGIGSLETVKPAPSCNRHDAADDHVISISFQPCDAPTTDGYWIDSGQVFRDHGGLSYGWSHDITDGCRMRNKLTDCLLDTFIIPDRDRVLDGDLHWKISLQAGAYKVKLGLSDPHSICGRIFGNEGKLNGHPFNVGNARHHKEVTMRVTGPEVRLDGSYPRLCALCYIRIWRLSQQQEQDLEQISSSSPAKAADPNWENVITTLPSKVVAVAPSGETLAELFIRANSTVADLQSMILKKANLKGKSISIIHKGSKLSRLQVLRDVGLQPLVDSLVTVTVSQTQTINISFQPPGACEIPGYWTDCGKIFQDHGGLFYGWSGDNTDGCRIRHKQKDPLLDTFVIPDRSWRHEEGFHWKIRLQPGEYEVKLGFSDPHAFYGRKDGNAGKLNGCHFDVGSARQPKEVVLKVEGPEIRLDGSYPRLCALCYISICRLPVNAEGCTEQGAEKAESFSLTAASSKLSSKLAKQLAIKTKEFAGTSSGSWHCDLPVVGCNWADLSMRLATNLLVKSNWALLIVVTIRILIWAAE